MTAIFVDTSFYAAILNRRDQWHTRAKAAAATFRGRMVTSEYVLLEVANFCAVGVSRGVFLQLVVNLRNSPDVEIVAASPEDFQLGLDLFAARSDKNWSLTDCISFAIMERNKLTSALTSDEHFEQAGFQAMLRE